ncbi:TIGR00730 family Rossman fold protein [Fulvivirga sedimenti]|uniref:Cytokinin riboside 5'-monophosphate phosphoribohydrolase n=1 Tax=Fulvivirga sedimenti TaxID=2879465 RepID=A0A9X1L102_9BACT|nr:TIGR00730 family Rossman fold protein [Fulvivirga sedimenti]MCA6078394.1 TIGR00730 family Rossman fold protein [Fulvivirga sedimenti]
MKNICVFCGSSQGKLPIFKQTAIDFAKILVQENCTLIYGEGRLGLMGIIADTVLESGGNAIGVIPDFMMDKEVAHQGLTELRITASMHERKYEMARLADGFAVLPGGMGTLDEMAEILTWNQLLILKKPIGILNVNGYYDPLLKMMDEMVNAGFLRPKGRELLLHSTEPAGLIGKLKDYVPGNDNIWNSIKRG